MLMRLFFRRDSNHMSTINKNLPISIQEKISTFPESSYGAHCVTIFLADGRVFKEVYIAGNDTIVKVGSSNRVPFDPGAVIDVISEV